MVYGEKHGPEQAREEVNLKLVEAARDSMDELCRNMLEICFSYLNEKLSSDQQSIDEGDVLNKAIAKGLLPKDTPGLPLYVNEDLTDAPSYEGRSTKTVSMLFRRNSPEEGPEDTATGDMIRIYLPVMPDYQYPEQIPEDLMPPEMYLEFIPTEGKRELAGRYIIQRDETDIPKHRYSVYSYKVETDEEEQVIYDAIHDAVLHAGLMERIPQNIELASRIIRRLANFEVIPQRTSYIEMNTDPHVVQLPE